MVAHRLIGRGLFFEIPPEGEGQVLPFGALGLGGLAKRRLFGTTRGFSFE